MNVIEAIKKALELNTACYRIDSQAYSDTVVCVFPLKEPLWCGLILMPTRFLEERPKSNDDWKEIKLCAGWNPSADDILSNNWEVMEVSKIEELIAQRRGYQDYLWKDIDTILKNND